MVVQEGSAQLHWFSFDVTQACAEPWTWGLPSNPAPSLSGSWTLPGPGHKGVTCSSCSWADLGFVLLPERRPMTFLFLPWLLLLLFLGAVDLYLGPGLGRVSIPPPPPRPCAFILYEIRVQKSSGILCLTQVEADNHLQTCLVEKALSYLLLFCGHCGIEVSH